MKSLGLTVTNEAVSQAMTPYIPLAWKTSTRAN